MATLLEGLLLVQEPAITGSRLSPFAVVPTTTVLSSSSYSSLLLRVASFAW